MKTIGIVIFDDFTDIDLFLMWDILSRNKVDWKVKILGTKIQHCSAGGILIPTQGNITEANDTDVVLFSSGKQGIPKVIADQNFLKSFSLNPQKQIIGSICAGSFILFKLGFLKNLPAATHPDAKNALQNLGVNVIDKPLVCNGNIATAGGCLSAVYLIAWVIERLYDSDKRNDSLRELIPAGQKGIYEKLISQAITEGTSTNKVTCLLNN